MAQEQSGGPEWAVSADELERLTALFIQFNGALDPRAIEPREAKIEFRRMLEELHATKVAPRFHSVDFAAFERYARLECRQRACRKTRDYPSI